MTDFSKISIQALQIQDDLFNRVADREFEIHVFGQTWGSTALGFPGIGGSAMTYAMTWVCISTDTYDDAFVYFGGRFAYHCKCNDAFKKDLVNRKMASVMESGKYKK